MEGSCVTLLNAEVGSFLQVAAAVNEAGQLDDLGDEQRQRNKLAEQRQRNKSII